MSITFQKGQLTSMAYLGAFRQLFGDSLSRALFPEVMALLPDESKRVELKACFDVFVRGVGSGHAALDPGSWAAHR